jgi:hypothetical protein
MQILCQKNGYVMAKKAGYPGSSTIIKTGRSHASYERSEVSRQQQNHSAEAWRFEKLQNYLDSIAISI